MGMENDARETIGLWH